MPQMLLGPAGHHSISPRGYMQDPFEASPSHSLSVGQTSSLPQKSGVSHILTCLAFHNIVVGDDSDPLSDSTLFLKQTPDLLISGF